DPKDSSDKHLTFDKPLIEVLRGYEFKLTKVYIKDLTFLDASAVTIGSQINQVYIDESEFTRLTRKTSTDVADYKLKGSVLDADFTTKEKVPTLSIKNSNFEGNYVIPPKTEPATTQIKARTNKPVNADEPEILDEEKCGWEESAISIIGGVTDIENTKFKQFTQGAIYIKGGSLNILPSTTFDYNFSPYSSDARPNLGRNIICDGDLTQIEGTSYEIPDTHIHADPQSFLEDGEPIESYWILRKGECKIDGGLSNSASYLFQPSIES
ncbi:MAG: hypothetical protein EZS28_053198, partial [Streblomastix strix]